MAEGWKLIGVGIVLLGLALRLRTTLVVVAAALATGLVAGLPLLPGPEGEGLLSMLGKGFADNRLMSLFIITLPAVGLCERFGLQKRSGETLTAGSTGTLMTPMAANFNIVPTALLGMRDGNGVIRFQVPFALAMWLGHVLLLYAFIRFD